MDWSAQTLELDKLTSCVTLTLCINPSESQFPHLYDRDNNTSYKTVVRINWKMCVKCWNSKELKNGSYYYYFIIWMFMVLSTPADIDHQWGLSQAQMQWQVVKTSTHSPTYCSPYCTSDRHNRFSIHSRRERLPSRWISLYGTGVYSSCQMLAFQPLFSAYL